MTNPFGTVTIAPDVLSTIISLTAQDVPGVAALGQVPGGQRVGSLLGSSTSNADGVSVRIVDDAVVADCYLIAQSAINLLELGETVQAAICEALNEMVGMPVQAVNVYIQDLEQPHG